MTTPSKPEEILSQIVAEAKAARDANPEFEALLADAAGAPSLSRLVASILARALAGPVLPASTLLDWGGILSDTEERFAEDIGRYVEGDFSAGGYLDLVLFSNGFHALCSHRLSSALYGAGQVMAARYVQSMACRVFGADLHPAAVLGRRIFLDHGLGMVIGETAVVGDECVLFHGVTLGSTAAHPGRRHPTLGRGVLVGAGATIIGNIAVGDGARIAPGCLVVRDVPAGARIARPK